MFSYRYLLNDDEAMVSLTQALEHLPIGSLAQLLADFDSLKHLTILGHFDLACALAIEVTPAMIILTLIIFTFLEFIPSTLLVTLHRDIFQY